MLTMVEPYLILEENLTTYFENPASIESHSNCSDGKDSHWHRDDFDQGMMGKYNMYTL